MSETKPIGTNLHLTLVPVLVREFQRWLKYFETHVPFTKPEQLALHRKTIGIRRTHQSVGAAISDSAFTEALYDTLRAWGIGSRQSHLRPQAEFTRALRTAQPAIEVLDAWRIDAHGLDVDRAVDAAWKTIETLNIVENDAPLVAGTKTLHHLLPELIPPMDRAYTQQFFRWHNPQFQYAQGACFRTAFGALVFVARGVQPEQYVGTHPWHTSATKVLDNALVGLMSAIDDGELTQESSGRSGGESKLDVEKQPGSDDERGESQMVGFKLRVEDTYWSKGFFNVPVDFERFLSQDDGPVDIYLGTAGTPTVGRMARSANQNATPRVYGNKPLREFFQNNFKRGDSVFVEFVSPRSMRIGAPAA